MNLSEYNIAVVGAGGTIGAGLVETILRAGGRVIAQSHSDESVARAKKKIEGALAKALAKSQITGAQATAAAENISYTAGFEGLKGAHIVIECGPEDLDKKLALHRDVRAVVGQNVPIYTVSSSLNLDLLPDCNGGFHPFNPVPVMQLVEVIKGAHTSEDEVGRMVALARALGKVPVVIGKSTAGFVVNRVLFAAILQAIQILEEGNVDIEGIETAMIKGCGWPMGMLHLADLVGLDVTLAILENLRDGLSNPTFEPPQILRDLVAAGKLGKKTGEGFFPYKAAA